MLRKRFKELTDSLEKAEDKEITKHKEVLEGLLHLAINCHCYGDSMNEIYLGRNPCRTNQYKTNSKIRKAEENLGESELLKAEKGMFDVCKKCPYR